MNTSGKQTTALSKKSLPMEKQTEEEEEEEEEEQHYSGEQLSRVKFVSNRVEFEDVAKNAKEKIATNNYEAQYEPHRPPYVQSIDDPKQRNRVYEEVGTYIKLVNERKDALASDPFYTFLVLVSGRINTLLKRLGVDEISGRGGSGAGGEYSGAPPSMSAALTPQKGI